MFVTNYGRWASTLMALPGTLDCDRCSALRSNTGGNSVNLFILFCEHILFVIFEYIYNI